MQCRIKPLTAVTELKTFRSRSGLMTLNSDGGGSSETKTPPGVMRGLNRVDDVNAINISNLGETTACGSLTGTRQLRHALVTAFMAISQMEGIKTTGGSPQGIIMPKIYKHSSSIVLNTENHLAL
ncbi:hypothetical protein C5H23_10500 [Xylella fastidiosa]|nr:hypothetical protein [Xylella fastidiosa subsp. multiplex]TNV88453.1 hypothetical protein C5H23_10500 [Xylella fastidiosa]RWA37514.1 hypothetical protein XfCFBP8078_07110 [Xylella fastidiosa subsp. multiplex]TNV96400.1 hypothetical protein C5H22_03110 [Xylella fastidiosa]TNV98786.1 hypothetical protein C5H21_06815 [Xylella fastidiosa]